MPAEGFYRRLLPEGLISFSSPEGRRLFREALAAGTMEGYFPLAEQFHTQAEPAFCGLGTLVIVLNALSIDPGRLWRGPWRWYSEELLDCCRPLEVIRSEGITIEDFACLSRCNGASAVVSRPPTATLDGFRQAVAHAARTPDGPHLVVAYDRSALGQTGAGHYSPVGAYHEGRDLALLLDVARFKYPPCWVPVPLLYQALHPVDPSTGRPRGYLLLDRAVAPGLSLCRVSCRERPFAAVLASLRAALAALLEDAAVASPGDAVAALLRHLPVEAADLLEMYTDTLGGHLAPEHRALLQETIRSLRHTELFRLVEQAMNGSAQEGPAVQRWLAARAAPTEHAALLLLILPAELCPPGLRRALEGLWAPEALPPTLRGEVERLKEQVRELERRCCAPGAAGMSL